jgi:hypothetical protein
MKFNVSLLFLKTSYRLNCLLLCDSIQIFKQDAVYKKNFRTFYSAGDHMNNLLSKHVLNIKGAASI